MSDGLTSAAVPPIGSEDHAWGEGPEVTLYLDLSCPHCAAAWSRMRGLRLKLHLRHFPLASKHPRAPVLHHAAEAAGEQREDAFHSMWDSILADRGHHDDPHLWARAERLDLDLDRFERDRRSERVAERVRRDFLGGIRAGVVATPAGFVAGQPLPTSSLEERLTELASGG